MTPASVRRCTPFESKAFEKACYIALKFGGKPDDLERDCAVEDVGLRIQRLQVMERWGLRPKDYDDIIPRAWRETLARYSVLSDMQGYANAENKIAAERQRAAREQSRR